MRAIYYSLVLTSEASAYQNQWMRSITSLRRYNQAIPVYLFLFNEPTQAILDKAQEYKVVVECLGPYRDCLIEVAEDEGAALSCVPTLNKLLPLNYFGNAISQVLFLDCDTFFFGDVEALFSSYQQCRWYAREEPHSRRSVFLDYRPAHIDEDALSSAAVEIGSNPFPPYNSGVALLNHGLAAELFELRRDFLRNAWRLTLGAALSSEIALPRELKEAAAKVSNTHESDPIPFPSKNFWILEQIALWLTMGKIQGLSHGQFSMADVLQNGEFMMYRSYKSRSIVVHYLRGNEALFLGDSVLEGGGPGEPAIQEF